MTDAPTPPPRLCPRCGLRPCRIGQRICAQCHRNYKLARRAEPQFTGETLRETTRETASSRETVGNGVVRAPIASAVKVRPGRKVPEGWQTTVLGYLRKHGTRWLAARQAGVSHDSLTRYEHADPAFARKVHDALQEFADSLEENADRLARRQNNIIANIILLKKHRPGEYIEKNLTVTAHFTTELPAADGKVLLAAMFGQSAATPGPPTVALPEGAELRDSPE